MIKGPIPVSASADVMEAALNSLWSIKPDTVQVSKQDDSEGSHYTITFYSDRGMKRQRELVREKLDTVEFVSLCVVVILHSHAN